MRTTRNLDRGPTDAGSPPGGDDPRMDAIPPHRCSTVVVAGAGMAGIEAALALRAFAGDGAAAVTVVDPGGRFAIAATAAGSAFDIAPSVDLPLSRVVACAGATLRRSRVVAVDARRRLAMLAGGELLGFDTLIVAVGARLAPLLPEGLNFRGHSDVGELRSLVQWVLAHAERGGKADLVVVIPAGCAWPLAGYEIALMARELLLAAGHGNACQVAVITAEDAPLAAFGPRAVRAAVRALRRVGVEIVTGSQVRAFDWGRLAMDDGTSREADRLVSLPVMRGPALPGLPADADGFVRCAPDGTVADDTGVRVVGDAGTFSVKSGGVACRQADSAAASIARGLGADVEESPSASATPEWAWGRGDGWPLNEEEDQEAGGEGAHRFWPVPKMTGRFLTPFLHELTQTPSSLHLVGDHPVNA